MKIQIMIVAVAGAWLALAMPDRRELVSAQTAVREAMGADIRALESSSRSPDEVAGRHLELAAKARNESEKYLLLQGAFNIYAMAGRYDDAAKALETMNAEIKDMDPAVVIEIYDKVIRISMKEKSPKLYAIRESAGKLVDSREVKVESGVTESVTGENCDLSSQVLDLGDGVTLDMVKCPPGEFVMGKHGNAGPGEVREHKVRLTRPFLLGRFPVTVEQWMMVMAKKSVKDRYAVNNKSSQNKEKFLSAINGRFKNIIPSGYKFRLPTEAELAYAMTSGGKDVVDGSAIGVLGPSDADKVAAAKRARKQIGNRWSIVLKPTEIGLNKANSWGFYDVIGNGKASVLDVVVPGSSMRGVEVGKNGEVKSIAYSDIEIDPLCWDFGKRGALNLFCEQNEFWARNAAAEYGWNDSFRVCLGPDLVAEKQKIAAE